MPLGDIFPEIAKLGIRARTKERVDSAMPMVPEARDPQEQADRDYAPLARILGNVLNSAYTLPQRLFNASEERRQGGNYDPAPVVELMGSLYGLNAPFAPGIGAFGAGRRLGPKDFESILQKQRSTEAHTAQRTGPETIKWAAVKDPQGNVYEGSVHRDARLVARESDPNIGPDTFMHTGFTTSKGRFVSRDEATRIAKKSKQVEPEYRGGLDAAEYYNPYRKPWFAMEQKPALKTVELPKNAGTLEEFIQAITDRIKANPDF